MCAYIISWYWKFYVNMENITSNNVSSTSNNFNLVTAVSLATLQLVLMFIICFGNGLTIAAVFKFHWLQTLTNMFVTSLAVADFLMGAVLPFHAVLFLYPSLLNEKYVCLLRYCTILLPGNASLMNLLFIAVDRYIAIIYPLHYFQMITPTRNIIILVIIWTYCTVMSYMPLAWNTWYDRMTCEFTGVIPYSYTVLMVVCQYFILTTIMLALYCKILIVARSQRCKPGPSVGWEKPEAVQSRKNTKGALLLAVVLVIFLLSFSPFCLLVLIQTTLYNNDTLNLIGGFSTLLLVANSGMNPFIYGWKNREFKRAFKKLLCKNRIQSQDMVESFYPDTESHAS